MTPRINFLFSRHVEYFDPSTYRWIKIDCPGMSKSNAVEIIENLKKIKPNSEFRIVNDGDVML